MARAAMSRAATTRRIMLFIAGVSLPEGWVWARPGRRTLAGPPGRIGGNVATAPAGVGWPVRLLPGGPSLWNLCAPVRIGKHSPRHLLDREGTVWSNGRATRRRSTHARAAVPADRRRVAPSDPRRRVPGGFQPAQPGHAAAELQHQPSGGRQGDDRAVGAGVHRVDTGRGDLRA